MTPILAILEGQRVVRVYDFMEWAKWLKMNQNHLGWAEIGDSTVSTIFTGIYQNGEIRDEPQFFETVILGGPYNGYVRRYRTYEDAIKGHRAAVALVRMEVAP